jgi:carbamoyl-phosphate synthase small subunit
VLALTYPLVGNYGVPDDHDPEGVDAPFESDRIQVAGLIVSEASGNYSHRHAVKGLADWLREQQVPALSGVDVRALTKRLRAEGTMLGKLLVGAEDTAFRDTDNESLVPVVSVKEPVVYPGGHKRVVVIDCGCKSSIIRSLLSRGLTVVRVPWNYDFLDDELDGLVISNGPGDPKMCQETIRHVRQALGNDYPIFGICLGHQILALAVEADTYKLKFGHRSQNQPCEEAGTARCYITSQNHGYAVDERTLPEEWVPWFTNANDRTNEGLRHRSRRFMSVQFHPEAAPGPADTNFLFDQFVRMLHGR